MRKLFTLASKRVNSFYLFQCLLSFMLFGHLSFGQVSFTSSYTSHSENFNSLASSGTSNPWTNGTTLNGWFLFRQPTSAPVAITTYAAGNGSSGTGGFYSFGTVAADRAFGGIGSGGTYFGSPASGDVAGWIAFAATNNTGAPITSVTISFSGEQWRNGGNTSPQTMVLEYGFGSSFTAVTTWTQPGGTFNWTSPVTGATAAAVDGNAAGKISGRGGTISSLNWTVGETLWIRWIELNDTGNDHGLAIDDFSISVTMGSPTKDITSFIINVSGTNYNGVIDESALPNPTISVEVPIGTSLTSLTPTITHNGISISPTGAQDFTNPVNYVVTASDATTKTYTVTVTATLAVPKLIISQVYEGLSNNKWIELANISTVVVDLSQYKVRLWANAVNTSGSPTAQVTLSGMLNPGSTFVIKRSSATVPTGVVADLINDGVTGFNGEGSNASNNDLIALTKLDNTIVDLFGQVGTLYKDKSLYRKLTVTSANATYNPSEWNEVDLATVDNATGNVPERLGYHGANDSKQITVFSLTFSPCTGENQTVSGTINHTLGTITLTAPFGSNLTSLTPTITHTGISISPSGAQNFTTPVTYTVTAADASTKNYTVTVNTSAANTQANINSFKFTIGSVDYFGVINESALPNPTITVELPLSTNVTALTPSITKSSCATVSPSGAQNFSSPVNYTVTAQDGVTTKTYTVNVTFAPPSSAKNILSFVINGYSGVITGNNIVVTLPPSTPLNPLTPTITVSPYATVSPASGVPQNFTNPVTYTVTAQDASTKTYTVTVIWADDYYAPAYGLKGFTLKTALFNIIKNSHTPRTYSDLWGFYSTYEIDSEEGAIWDMYSENPLGPDPYNFTPVVKQCGTYSGEGDCYNREHSFPRSWFGGTIEPMNSDVHHIFPTDGYVNSQRSNFPYGVVGTASWTSQNGSKVGTAATWLGYSGTVFEPLDAFKGDFARAQLYMAVRYQDLIDSWESNSPQANAVLNGTETFVFEPWYLNMLIAWHNADPVSAKEIARNNAAFNYQGNRNPFIDHPEWVADIWLHSSPIQINGVLNHFGNVEFGNESAPQSYQVSASGLSSNLVINAPTHFQISLAHGSGYTNTLTLPIDINGDIPTTTIYVKFVPASAFGTNITASITHTSGTVSANQVASGREGSNVVNLPLIEYFDACGIPAGWTAISVSSNKNWACNNTTKRSGSSLQINGFGGDTNSEDWLITPKLNVASYLDVTVSFYATTRFSGANPWLMFSSNYSGMGNPNSATWIPLKEITGLDGVESTFEEVTYTGSFTQNGYFAIKYTGTPTTSQRFTIDDFAVTGNSTGISITGTLNNFGYVQFGNESGEQSYTVAAAGLPANLVITAPTNYQISTTSGSGFGSTITLTIDGFGNIAPTTVYVKFVPTFASGSVMSGNITHISGSESKDIFVTGTEGIEPVNLFYEPFEDGTWTSTWIRQNVSGKNSWQERTFAGNKYAQMSAYNGDPTEEDWLISPPINMDYSTNEVLSFKTKAGYYNGTAIAAFYTTNWTGNVATTTWNSISATFDVTAPSNGYSTNFTHSGNINLSAVTGIIRIAFRYLGGNPTITTTYQVDDVKIVGIEDPTIPRLKVTPTSLIFPRTLLPNPIVPQTFTLTTKYLGTHDVEVSVGANFEVSIDGGTSWGNLFTIPNAVANGKVVHVRPVGSINRTADYNAVIHLTAVGAMTALNTSLTVSYIGTKQDANALPRSQTLDVVSWNIEWFGYPANSNNATSFTQQLNAVSAKMIAMDADVYALQEVVQTPTDNYLQILIDKLNELAGSDVYDGFYGEHYSYYWQPFNPTFPPQKLAFVYKKATVTVKKTRSILDVIHDGTTDVPGFVYAADPSNDSKLWSSGRLPMLVVAEVNIGGVKREIDFVNVHAKCCPDSKARKEADAQLLFDSLQAYAGNRNVLILGDLNDYMNGSMSGGSSPYQHFFVGGNQYYKHVVGLDNKIDHFLISNELYDEFDALYNNAIYETTTISDHNPIMGRFLLEPLPVLTITANNASKTYGQANPTLTATYSGFVGSDNPSVLDGTLTLTTTATTASPAGTYPINASGHSSVLYDITYVPGTLTVNPAPLTIKVNNTTKIQGTPNPTFTVSYTGFVNGDTPASLTGSLSFSTTATTSSPVGTYPVSVSGVSSPNYSITFVDGELEIVPLSCIPVNGLIANVANNAFTLSWNAFPTATAYRVKVYFAANGSLAYNTVTTATSWSKTGVIATSYTWTVEAVTTLCSAGTTLANGTTFTVPTCVPPVVVTTSHGGINSFELSWLPVTGVSTYSVTLYNASGNPLRTISTSNTTIQGINLPDGNYFWTIQFNTSCGLVGFYGGTFNVLSCLSFNSFGGLNATGGNGTITLNWTHAVGSFNALYRYNFRVRPKGSSTWTYSGRVSTTSVTFNLPAGLYEWEAMANLFGAPTTCFSNWKKGNDVVVNAPSGSSTRETWNDLSTADVLADNIEFVNLGTKEETFVDGLDQPSLLLVYPNPTKDVVSIQIGNISGKGNLAIYNVVGELIHQQEVRSGQLVKDFSLEKYPRGVYIVRLTSSGETNTCKFVLE